MSMKVGDLAITEYMGNYYDGRLLRKEKANGKWAVRILNDKREIVAQVYRAEEQIRLIATVKNLAELEEGEGE